MMSSKDDFHSRIYPDWNYVSFLGCIFTVCEVLSTLTVVIYTSWTGHLDNSDPLHYAFHIEFWGNDPNMHIYLGYTRHYLFYLEF